MSELGNRIKAARAYAGDMNQEDLAAKLPFSLSTLQRTEAGGRDIGELEMPAFTKAVSKATGLPVWFFTADLNSIAPDETEADEGQAQLQQQLAKLQRELGIARREFKAELEKAARSKAHDRGRLKQIEKNLATLAEAVVVNNRKTK